MPGCAVACCGNSERSGNVTFHRLPKNALLRKAWIHACKRKDAFNPDSVRICSDHFLEEDFQRDMKAELLGVSSHRRLKIGSVPHLKIPGSTLTEENHRSSQKRAQRLEKRKLIQSLSENDTQPKLKVAKSNEGSFVIDQEIENRNESHTSYPEASDILAEKNRLIDILKRQIESLLKANSDLKKRCLFWQERARSRYLATRSASTKNAKTVANVKSVNRKVKENVDNLLSGVFTKNQISALYTKTRVTWASNDIVMALSLRGLSKRAYNFVRSKMHIPLPGISTCKRWVSSIKFSPGILHEVIQLMSENAKTLTSFEKLCVLLLDEMSIDSKIAYDHSEDIILGPHKNVQVVMVRGLTKPWKQPVFYDFDCKMTKCLLFDIINEVENAGYEVIALTSDLGGGNQALWKVLGISTDVTFFPNPFDELRNVFVFADTPHLLKLLRNHLLDSGVRLASGTVITSEPLVKILKADNKELQLCHKLTEKHLLVKGTERMKVSYAAQIFSFHVSSAIRYLFPTRTEIADFFKLVNNAFDILNSRCPTHSVPLKRAYGFDIDTQNSVLNNMEQTMRNMRVMGRGTLLPFQHGFIVNISSLQKLYQYLSGIGVSYLLTSRLNQDCLENLFSQIRGMGHTYDYPLPSEFKYRLRLMLLSGQLLGPSSESNVTEFEKLHFLTASCLNILNHKAQDIDGESICNENMSVQNEQNIENAVNASENLLHTVANDVCKIVYDAVPHSTEDDALQYIAGYLCFRIERPLTDCCAVELLLEENEFSWIKTLSRGGLNQPSRIWVEKVMEFENVFKQIHGNNFQRQKGVVRHLFSVLKGMFPEVNEKALLLFSRLRIFIRIKFLNKCSLVTDSKKTKKKAKQWLKSVTPK